jgi:hypothetical protein
LNLIDYTFSIIIKKEEEDHYFVQQDFLNLMINGCLFDKVWDLNDIGSNSPNHKTIEKGDLYFIGLSINIILHFIFYNIFFNYSPPFSNAFKTYFLNEKTILFWKKYPFKKKLVN